MHDIWNPWHGCIKCSEGCQNCYMFFIDSRRGMDGSKIYKTKQGFDYPLQKNRNGGYKVKSGEQLRVCMNSDFFLEEADCWREDVWNIIHMRPDVIFFLLTKRPERVERCLPKDWGNGWENVFFNVTCENQKRADERIPIMLELPFRHKGIMAAPFIGKVSIEKYLSANQIEQVICCGENYAGARVCNFEWVKSLSDECRKHNVTFCFIETGTCFVKDGKKYFIPNKSLQSKQAYKSGVNFKGKPINFSLTDNFGRALTEDELYIPHFRERCDTCSSKLICNGCSDCGQCQQP